MLIKDITTAEPTKYDTTIISIPPVIGTQEPCFLP
jgi:hypothetical protein